jgi:hydrogenase expression/formation protein HypC
MRRRFVCLAVPLRIETIEGETALVELGGVRRQVSLVLTPEAQVGDYVMIHTGFALSVLDEEEALETLELFRSMEEMAEST